MPDVFSYTNSSGSTKTLTFATSGRMLNGSDEFIDLNEVKAKTADGKEVTHKFGPEIYSYQMLVNIPVSSESESDYADFKEFIGSSYINGSVNEFTWTDYNSEERTVKLLNINVIKNMRLNGAHYKQISMTLKEET